MLTLLFISNVGAQYFIFLVIGVSGSLLPYLEYEVYSPPFKSSCLPYLSILSLLTIRKVAGEGERKRNV